MMKSHTFFSSGQALAEIIFALAMVMMLLAGMIVAVRAGLLNSEYSQHKIQAAHLAQESIEKIKAIRDRDGWDAVNSTTTPTSAGDTGSGYIQINGLDTIFQRGVVIVENDDQNGGTAGRNDEKRITVTISWDEHGKTGMTMLTTVLTNHD